MIDVVGLIFGTAVYAVTVGVLVGFSPVGKSTKLVALAAAAGWGGIIVVTAGLGGFAPGATSAVPGPVLAFAGFLTLLLGAWFLVPRFQNALLSVPLPALVGLNAVRFGGVLFLILAADGRLSAPFALSAGWGDIIVAALAIPLAAIVSRGTDKHPAWLGVWNGLGALDLIVAASLGLLSAEATPFRVFTGPGILALTAMPWIMIPAMLVPLYLLIHLTIAAKLRSAQLTTQAVAMARKAA